MTIVALAWSRDAAAYHDRDTRWTPQTAYVQRPGGVDVGILSADVGVLPGVAAGTDTLPWAASLFLPMVVPNAHVQISPLPAEPIAIAVRGAAYYASARAEDGSRASVWLLPIALRVSITATRVTSLHFEVQYTYLTGTSDVRTDELSVQGGAVSSNVQLGAMAMFRLGRVVALYARGRYQPWQRGARVDATSRLDAYTDVDAEGNVKPIYSDGAWQMVGGVALSWDVINVQLGVGYGDLFLPGLGVVVPYEGVVPDANLFLRF